MSTAQNEARVVPPSEGNALHVVGDIIRIKVAGTVAARPFSMIEEETPPNGGPPLHNHSREDETFYIMEGEFEFRVGDTTVRPQPGSYVLAPRGIPHTFKNVGQQAGRMMVTISPPGFEAFFEDVDALGDSASPETLMGLAEKYGLEFLPP